MTLYEYKTPTGTYKVWLAKQKYANGRVALVLKDKNGEQVACATCNLPDVPLEPDEVLIKTWGENEYMMPFLLQNQLVYDLARDVPTGYVKARVVRLLV